MYPATYLCIGIVISKVGHRWIGFLLNSQRADREKKKIDGGILPAVLFIVFRQQGLLPYTLISAAATDLLNIFQLPVHQKSIVTSISFEQE